MGGRGKGGESRKGNTIEVYLPQTHPFRSMAKSNQCVYRARLVMAKMLGRPLTETETVHHRNEIQDDDRHENLRLYDVPGKHSSDHRKKKPHLPNHIASERRKEGSHGERSCESTR